MPWLTVYPNRAIISQIGSSTYKLAKFLLPFIQPLNANEYTVKDTFHFVSMTDSKGHRLVMVSLDVDLLFSNIVLQGKIDIVTEKLYSNTRTVNGIRKNVVKTLDLSKKGTVLIFNGKY